MNSKSLSDYYYNHSFMVDFGRNYQSFFRIHIGIAAIDIELFASLISCMEEVPETRLSAIFVPV